MSDMIGERISEISFEFCGDYPGIKECPPLEKLFAIESTLRGWSLAFGDWEKFTKWIVSDLAPSIDASKYLADAASRHFELTGHHAPKPLQSNAFEIAHGIKVETVSSSYCIPLCEPQWNRLISIDFLDVVEPELAKLGAINIDYDPGLGMNFFFDAECEYDKRRVAMKLKELIGDSQ